MYLSRSLTVLSALAVLAQAVPTRPYVVHEFGAETADEWAKGGTLPRKGRVPVRIGLTQSNLDHGHDVLMDLSNPQSANYGRHLTAEQVHAMFAPRDESADAVRSWLTSEGIAGSRITQSHNQQWIEFSASIDELERLLKTQYGLYTHRSTGAQKIGADHYSIPADLQAHVDMISPAATKLEVRRPRHPPGRRHARALPHIKKRALNVTDDCSRFITPQCYRDLYGIPLGTESVPGNDLGIYELSSYNQHDLNVFLDKYAPFIKEKVKPVGVSIDGGPLAQKPSGRHQDQGEAMLDLEVAVPIIYPQDARYFSVDDAYVQNGHETFALGFNHFLDALDGSYCDRKAFGEKGDDPKYDPKYPDHHPNGYHGTTMCGTKKPSNVISISWSPSEHDRTVSYDRRQCSEWMKLSLQGVTVVAATGDYGVAGNQGYCLKDPHGKETIFKPLAITNCPYVVAVGATALPKGAETSAANEIASTSFASSGGFSNYFPQPHWQKDAVDRYFDEKPSPYPFYHTQYARNVTGLGGLFNRAGRALPDVSANGDHIVALSSHKEALSWGTSASAPAFAAIINRINGERLKAGKSSVGFITPTLYANPQVLQDITQGHNKGCHTKGFEAAKGWDPVTGLGTPNYPRMLDLFMGYQ